MDRRAPVKETPEAAMTKEARKVLSLTQEELGGLLGKHWMTVSKWERGDLAPNAYLVALMRVYIKAGQRDKSCGRRAVEGMKERGVAYGVYVLLSAAFTK